MRFRTLAASIAAVTVLVAAGWALGQNVLLPSDNGPAPNLGFEPTQPTQPAEPSKPEPAPAPVPTPLPALPPVTVAPPVPKSPQPAQPPADKPQPRRLTISLQPLSPFTASDIENVHNQLNLPASKVVSACEVGMSGLLSTDSEADPLESNQRTNFAVDYNGAITNAIVSIYAACDAPPSPQSEYLPRIGSKYSVILGSTFCAPDKAVAGTVTQLTINHTGSGSDSCVWR